MLALTWFRLVVIISLSVLLSACGAGDAVTPNPNLPTPPQANNYLITSSSGLSVSINENIEITVAANSVDSDTEISYENTALDEAATAQGIITSLHTLAPESLTFQKPITISLKIPDDYALGGQLYLARLTAAGWITIDNSTVSERFVSAQVSQLGTFAIRMQRIVEQRNMGTACDANASEQAVRFVHVADLHARFGYQQQYFSRIKAYHKQVLAETPYTLFTNGGDDYEKGTVAEQISQGLATDEAIKAMRFDLRVIGNHDYAWGPETLINFSQDSHATVLASNTRYEGESKTDFGAVDFAKVQVGCITLGVFGMTSVPWNELDRPLQDDPIPDFIKQFKMSWQWQQIAQSIVNQYAAEVDYMVMLSHLGEGLDTKIATNVQGIDLVLGGHTHGGESFTTLNNGALVIQPDFYAKGITDLNLTFSTGDKTLKNIDYKTLKTDTITERDAATQQAIDTIMGRYAPDAQTEIAISENYLNAMQLTAVTAAAVQHSKQTISAALLNPELVQKRWTPGALTQEDFHKAYYVERQPSNTPGFNSLYTVTVSGTDLNAMLADQPDWFLLTPDTIEAAANYQVALFKGPALNPELFFNGVTFNDVAPIAEAWWLLDQYARFRTSQCLHIDTDTPLNACQDSANITIWNFTDSSNPLKADFGPSTLSYFDPDNKGWGPEKTRFGSTSAFNIADLADGPATVMAFTDHSPTEGLEITLNTAANGDFANEGRVSDYTLVMDIYWPYATKDIYRALIQTDATNDLNNDADIFISPFGGLGISTTDSGYFGRSQPDNWHRIAFVFYSAPENGVFEVYIDGEFKGVKRDGDIGKRWSLDQAVLLLTDNNYETEPGYLNALLYAGRAMTRAEIKSMGHAKTKLTFQQATRTLNQTIKRHYQQAPAIKPNLWLKQRQRFFGTHKSVNN
ncbi:metallophosphoesterase [Pseudoalteromonas sp.]|uniref:metallophosphoesterase n=1 Tax=Pseudoalteromonas sp. TaxID=53249 RepID=UPI0035662B65